jgi:hypothetical protein
MARKRAILTERRLPRASLFAPLFVAGVLFFACAAAGLNAICASRI